MASTLHFPQRSGHTSQRPRNGGNQTTNSDRLATLFGKNRKIAESPNIPKIVGVPALGNPADDS
jgi:hypothetical protein